MSETTARDVLLESLEKMTVEEAREKVVEFFDARESTKKDFDDLVEEADRRLDQKDAEIRNLQISLEAQVQIANNLTDIINESKKSAEQIQSETDEQAEKILRERETANTRSPDFN